MCFFTSFYRLLPASSLFCHIPSYSRIPSSGLPWIICIIAFLKRHTNKPTFRSRPTRKTRTPSRITCMNLHKSAGPDFLRPSSFLRCNTRNCQDRDQHIILYLDSPEHKYELYVLELHMYRYSALIYAKLLYSYIDWHIEYIIESSDERNYSAYITHIIIINFM